MRGLILSKNDFLPVVKAFKDLLEQFRCKSPNSWVYINPKGPFAEVLRCPCSAININLKTKPK